jgi:hypothetical protein
MILQILDLAKDDLIEGYHFYEKQEVGLGNYFVSCLYSDIESLKLYAGIHRKVHKELHWLLSNRFPFAVYYSKSGDLVQIRAVVDCRRKPSWIRRHLKNA